MKYSIGKKNVDKLGGKKGGFIYIFLTINLRTETFTFVKMINITT